MFSSLQPCGKELFFLKNSQEPTYYSNEKFENKLNNKK